MGARSTPPATASFVSRVRDALSGLPPTERRLGEFLLDFPGNLSGYSASELAGLTGVSNASVTRFVRRLGYESYDEARRHAREAGSSGAPLYLGQPGEGTESKVAGHIRQAHDNLANTFNHIPAELIDTVAQAMVSARRLVFLGQRQNRNFAAYLRWQLLQVLDNQPVVIPGPGETLAEYGAQLGSEDLLVVFALRRSVPAVARFVAQAHRAGVPVLCITDHFDKSAWPARWLLRCHTQAPGPLDNHVALMMLCHLLATRAMELAGQAGRRRMAAIESGHEALDEL